MSIISTIIFWDFCIVKFILIWPDDGLGYTDNPKEEPSSSMADTVDDMFIESVMPMPRL